MTKTVEQVITETSSLEQSSLLDEIMSHTRIASDSEGYDVAKQGVAAFIRYYVAVAQRPNRLKILESPLKV